MINETNLTQAERNVVARLNDCNTPVTPADRNLLLKLIEKHVQSRTSEQEEQQ